MQRAIGGRATLPLYPPALLGTYASLYQMLPRPRHQPVLWNGDHNAPLENLFDRVRQQLFPAVAGEAERLSVATVVQERAHPWQASVGHGFEFEIKHFQSFRADHGDACARTRTGRHLNGSASDQMSRAGCSSWCSASPMVMARSPSKELGRSKPKTLSQSDRQNPKFESCSSRRTEWWIRCKSGVTIKRRTSRSSPGGNDVLA